MGRSLQDIERILGFHAGRFSKGITVVALLQLPQLEQFDLGGYSNIATHNRTPDDALNINKVKENALASWSTMGVERIVKVLPGMDHDQYMDSDSQYPAGLGAPQWKAKIQLEAIVTAVVAEYPRGLYLPR